MGSAKETKERAPVYRVALDGDVNAVQFNLDGVEIELTADNPTLDLDNQQTWKQLLELPFLKDAS